MVTHGQESYPAAGSWRRRTLSRLEVRNFNLRSSYYGSLLYTTDQTLGWVGASFGERRLIYKRTVSVSSSDPFDQM